MTMPGKAGSITLASRRRSISLRKAQRREAAPIVLMGPQWHEWLAQHRGPAFVPLPLHGLVEVADTPELAAERVAAGIERARGLRLARYEREGSPA